MSLAKGKKDGFTLIEILIVMGLMAMLLTLSAPFVTALRSDIAIQRTLRQIKTDLVAGMSYSLAGKSFAALAKDNLVNPELIPAAYAVFFQTDESYGDQTPYRYLEFTAAEDGLNQTMQLSYDAEQEYVSPAVYLKGITLASSATNAELDVDSAYVIFMPPFARLLFLNEDESFLKRVSEYDFYQNQRAFDLIKLHFQFKDDEYSETTLVLNQSKVINIE